MCGRFSLDIPTKTLADLFRVAPVPELPPRYNIAPTQPVAAVRHPPEGEREMVLLHWGLIPAWAKDPEIGGRLINARSETVAEKPAFRAAFRRRRCLVPADGFYEWQRFETRKQPYYVRMSDGSPFAFAGLWEHWEGPDGTVIESCTILTTDANALIRPVHHRMPVILDPGDYDLWLTGTPDDLAPLGPLMQPFPPDRLVAVPVSTRVNNPMIDDARCIEPLA